MIKNRRKTGSRLQWQSIFKTSICSLLAVLLLLPAFMQAQSCYTNQGCQDYSNFGSNSVGKHAGDLEYDNFVASFHSTIVRDIDGNLKIWGPNTNPDGVSSFLSPTIINSTNFANLTGTPLKGAVGSQSTNIQHILLTSDSKLWAWGTAGAVISTTVKSGTAFGSFSLPTGVLASDVKMMFATNQTLVLTTCGGMVYVLTQNNAMRGDGSTGATTWATVQKSTGGNLTGIVAVRGCPSALIALDNTGNLWTWGTSTWNGSTNATNRNLATQMTLPGGTGAIKMIGASGTGVVSSYYVLYENGSLYALGENSGRQLGDWSTTNKNSWIQPRYSNGGSVMNDIAWISPNEHDATYPFISAITTGNILYNWGNESGDDLGRGINASTSNGVGADPGAPTNFSSGTNANIIAVASGGHTTMILRKCEDNFGYVGHKIAGSMGDGTSASTVISQFSFNTAAVQVCGAPTKPVIQFAASASPDNSGAYYIGTAVQLTGTPAGGTFAITSGTGLATISASNQLTFNGTGTVTVSYSGGGLCGQDVKTFTVNSSVLPVTFGLVTARFENEALMVNWTTETEINNDHFEIEASADGIHFTSIGTVKSLAPYGNSKTALQYQFSKKTPGGTLLFGISLLALGGLGFCTSGKRRTYFTLFVLSGFTMCYMGCTKADVFQNSTQKSFIRIAQVDINGTKSYSKVITVTHE